MTKKEFNEAKHLWKLIQAEIAIEQSLAAAEFLYRSDIPTKNPLYGALLASVYTLYGKPFTDTNGVGMLSPKIIPSRIRAEHHELMQLRHRLFAHGDALSLKTKFGPVSQAWFTFKSNENARMTIPYLALPPEKLFLFTKYLAKIVSVVHEEMVKCLGAFVSHKPQDNGQYALNVYDESKPVFIPRADVEALLPADATLLEAILHPDDED